jgi:hypothetical protein
MILKANMNDKIVDQKIYYLFFTKEGGTMKEIIISIVSMQIGAFIGIATMCFFQINKGNGSSDKQ